MDSCICDRKVEVETGKSNVKSNLEKVKSEEFDRVVLVATSPAAVSACQGIVGGVEQAETPTIELLSWLDIS